MTPQEKTEWLAALRSGAYQQCKYVLHDVADHNFGYCCLGVLWDTQREWHDEARGVAKDIPHGFVNLFRDEFGLPEEFTQKLAKMNDSGAPFARIADYIESELVPVSLVDHGQ